MGRSKALLDWRGRPLILEVADRLSRVTPHLLVVGGDAGVRALMDVPTVTDVFPGRGPLGGLHAALHHATTPWVILVGCDQPFVDTSFLTHLLKVAEEPGTDAVVPVLADGKVEPLCAAYSRRVLLRLTDYLKENDGRRMVDFYPLISVRYLAPPEWEKFGHAGRLFLNINTPADLDWARRADSEGDNDAASR